LLCNTLFFLSENIILQRKRVNLSSINCIKCYFNSAIAQHNSQSSWPITPRKYYEPLCALWTHRGIITNWPTHYMTHEECGKENGPITLGPEKNGLDLVLENYPPWEWRRNHVIQWPLPKTHYASISGLKFSSL